MIIFDLDGTLALNEHRQHFLEREPKDWDGFFDACDLDEFNHAVALVAKALHVHGQRIEVWSGRSERVRAKTEAWLREHYFDGVYSKLLMRPEDDKVTPDEVLKRQWLDELEPEQWPQAVFDDRDKVVRMWRDAGIPCFQVAYGAF